MAKEEQISMLKRGVEAWKVWRKANTTTTIDLSGANLSRTNLRKADLSKANLMGAYLSGINLDGANLNGACLRLTNLSGASLREADLSEANLSMAVLINANLGAADLRKANLSKANLNKADLSEASLSEANLYKANLSGANLSRADLIKTNLSEANISNVNLSEANISNANLKKANLNEANLTNLHCMGAEFDDTMFVNVDLSGVHSLQYCYHSGPSSIDHRTLSKSGRLPTEFLRGCGLSDWEIETTNLYNSALALEDILDIQQRIFNIHKKAIPQFYPLFIVYSSEDEEVSKKMCMSLQESGVRCWLAKSDVPFQQPVSEISRNHDKALLIISKNSIVSPWIRSEIKAGLAKEREEGREVLFPITIDGEDKLDWPGAIHREIHLGDFSEWRNQYAYNESFKNILKALRNSDKPRK